MQASCCSPCHAISERCFLRGCGMCWVGRGGEHDGSGAPCLVDRGAYSVADKHLYVFARIELGKRLESLYTRG
jgi:hypothetical protein